MVDREPNPYRTRRALSAGAIALLLPTIAACGQGNFEEPIKKTTEFKVSSSTILKIHDQDLNIRYDDVARDIDAETNSCYTLTNGDESIQTREATLLLSRGDSDGARVGFRMADFTESTSAMNIQMNCSADEDGIVWVLGSYVSSSPFLPEWVTKRPG